MEKYKEINEAFDVVTNLIEEYGMSSYGLDKIHNELIRRVNKVEVNDEL